MVRCEGAAKKLTVSPSVATIQEIQAYLLNKRPLQCTLVTSSKKFGYLTLKVSVHKKPQWESMEFPIPEFNKKENLFMWIDAQVEKCR